ATVVGRVRPARDDWCPVPARRRPPAPSRSAVRDEGDGCMKRTKGLRALAIAALGCAAVGVPAALASPQIPGTLWSVSADDSGNTGTGGDDPVPQCSANGYSMSLSNLQGADITVRKYINKMSPGFTYVTGSSTLTDVDTGVTTPFSEPDLSN